MLEILLIRSCIRMLEAVSSGEEGIKLGQVSGPTLVQRLV